MKLSAMCIRCLIDRQEEKIREIADEDKKAAFLKAVAGIIASAGEEDSAPCLVYKINRIYESLFGEVMSYEKEKKEFNSLMLKLDSEMEKISVPAPIERRC